MPNDISWFLSFAVVTFSPGFHFTKLLAATLVTFEVQISRMYHNTSSLFVTCHLHVASPHTEDKFPESRGAHVAKELKRS